MNSYKILKNYQEIVIFTNPYVLLSHFNEILVQITDFSLFALFRIFCKKCVKLIKLREKAKNAKIL